MNFIQDYLAERGRAPGCSDADGPATCVMLTPRFHASRQVVFLVLPGDRSDPSIVAKVPRWPAAACSARREARNLTAIETRWGAVPTGVPRHLALDTFRGWPVAVQTALVGRALDQATLRRAPDEWCAAVGSWLTGLRPPGPPGDGGTGSRSAEVFARLVEPPLGRLAEAFGATGSEAELLRRTRDLVEPLRGAGLPLVVEHGDFSPPNVMRLRDDTIGAVDWELAEVEGLPATDLFFFLTTVAFARRRATRTGDQVHAFERAFFGPAAWAGPHAARYAERIGLGREWLTPLFVATWPRYVAGLLERHGATTPETLDWLRGNRYVALWRYAVTHAETALLSAGIPPSQASASSDRPRRRGEVDP